MNITNLSYTKIINSIESEIKSEYLPGAIKWADDHFDNAWSKAIDRFDQALTYALQNSAHYQAIPFEAELYRKTVLNLLKKYKAANNISDVSAYLDSISELPIKGAI